MSLSPEQRRLRARLAALVMHATGKTNPGPGSQAFFARFEREVDPDGVLPPDERARRAALARRAYMTRLAYKAATARKAARR